jgi:hypothetical protein
LYQSSRTHHPSPSSARQYNITEHPSSHRQAHLGRLSSLFQRNNYNTRNAPPRPSFLEWARSTSFHLSHRRDNEGIQLQARLPAVVHVPLAQGNYVSPPLFPSQTIEYIYHSEKLLSERSTDEERERERESKKCKECTERAEPDECFCGQLTARTAVWQSGPGPSIFRSACYCLHVVHHTCYCCYACSHLAGLAPRRGDTTGWALDTLLVIYWMCPCSIYRRSKLVRVFCSSTILNISSKFSFRHMFSLFDVLH